MKKYIFVLVILFSFLLSSCMATKEIERSKPFPSVLKSNKETLSVTVYAFKNYTDTPQAGQRAANLMEGLLSAKGYSTVNRVDDDVRTFSDKKSAAKLSGTQYMLIGGVSEWRYKTGIDGEPAISLQMKLIDVQSNKTVWSATGSDNSWGNASIGTTAQGLFESLIVK